MTGGNVGDAQSGCRHRCAGRRRRWIFERHLFAFDRWERRAGMASAFLPRRISRRPTEICIVQPETRMVELTTSPHERLRHREDGPPGSAGILPAWTTAGLRSVAGGTHALPGGALPESFFTAKAGPIVTLPLSVTQIAVCCRTNPRRRCGRTVTTVTNGLDFWRSAPHRTQPGKQALVAHRRNRAAGGAPVSDGVYVEVEAECRRHNT